MYEFLKMYNKNVIKPTNDYNKVSKLLLTFRVASDSLKTAFFATAGNPFYATSLFLYPYQWKFLPMKLLHLDFHGKFFLRGNSHNLLNPF